MSKPVTFAFGRFQPPTIGHRALINKVKSVANGEDYNIFTSHTQDAKKNPLEYHEKLGFMRSLFPHEASHIVQSEEIRTITDVLAYLQSQGYTDLKYVCGDDRVEIFTKILNRWNEIEKEQGRTPFNSINIISSGQRDPDSDGVAGVSASLARQYVKDNNYEGFAKIIGDDKIAKDLCIAIKNGMSLNESMKRSIKSIIKSLLREEEFDEKDMPKILALRKKTAADKVKEKSEVEKSVKGQLKNKQDALKLALRDTSPESSDKIMAAKADVDKYKKSADSATKMTTAAKSELSSIK